jgi:para-nitrobenzyl esterase
MKILIACIASLMAFSSLAQSPIVQTKAGRIAGLSNPETKVNKFLGIPFAKAPIGDLRWKAPQALDSWTGIRDTKSFSASPYQNKPAPFQYWSAEYLIPESPISEDCLYLNVWAPSQPKTKKAVFVYFYGGGFRSGGTACPIYDGESMAQQDIVFVSINYRVGVFGFLAHPELSAEAPYKSSGNYAILDMIAGLKWVQANIAAFGGDPNQVTIAGQSAGAFAVNFLCASPLAKGLFKGAIAESGGSVLASPIRPTLTRKQAEAMGVTFAANLQANSIEALRALPAETLQKASGGLSGPYTDGYVLPISIRETYEKGRQNDVALLMGWNKEDRVMGKPAADEVYKNNLISRYKGQASIVESLYPSTRQGDLNRDESFGVQVHSWAKLQNTSGKAPVYIYNFNRDIPAFDASTAFGAFHTGEVPYAYGNLRKVNRPWTKEDDRLSQQIQSYFVNFAKTSNPNGSSLPNWPRFDNDAQKTQILDLTIESKELPTRKSLELLESLLN